MLKGRKNLKRRKKEEDNLKIIQYTAKRKYNDLYNYFVSLLPKEKKGKQ